MIFNNLPGTLVKVNDGGLVARRTPSSRSTLILGTSAIGPADNPFPVVDKAAASLLFGTTGTISRALQEVGTSSDNLIVFRIGTTAATLNGVNGIALAAPLQPTGTASGSGGTTTTASAFAKVTYLDASLNETAASVESATIVVTAGNTITINSPIAETGAVYWNVYLSATTGTEKKQNASPILIGTNYTTTSNPTTTGVIAPATSALTQGLNVTLGARTSITSTDYTIWAKNGVVYLYYQGQLVYSNDPAYTLDIGDSLVTGSSTGGLQLGSGATASLANSITLTAAAALVGTTTAPAPVLTAAVTGIGLTARQTYLALQRAYSVLDNYPVEQVFAPGVNFDTPNVAYTATVDSSTAGTVLDWLQTTVAPDGHLVFQWASEITNSDGTTVTPPTFASATDRVAKGFHEVSFGYQLARFCALQTQVSGSCLGFIGFASPASNRYDVTSIRKWIGTLPTSDPVTGNPTAAGSGLLGSPYLTGTVATGLSTLCSDFSIGYRKPGYFDTQSPANPSTGGVSPLYGEYDGVANTDSNGNQVDIGQYVHACGDWALFSNPAGDYVNNIAGVVAGIRASLDPKSGLLNKTVQGVRNLYPGSVLLMDSLTAASINMLRFKGVGRPVVLLHDKTAANPNSDYILSSRVVIRGLLTRMIREVADKFLGETSNDGMQLQALKSALENRGLTLQKQGYLRNAQFTITASLVDQRLGHASVDVTFIPADELTQLTVNVGISRRTI